MLLSCTLCRCQCSAAKLTCKVSSLIKKVLRVSILKSINKYAIDFRELGIMTYLNVSVKPVLRCVLHCLLHRREGYSSSTNGAEDFTVSASYHSSIHAIWKSTRDTGQEATLSSSLFTWRLLLFPAEHQCSYLRVSQTNVFMRQSDRFYLFSSNPNFKTEVLNCYNCGLMQGFSTFRQLRPTSRL